jgi:hypothetical protein
MYSHKFNNNRIIFKPIDGYIMCINDRGMTLADYLNALCINIDTNCSKASFEYYSDKGDLIYTVDYNSWRTTCLETLTINIYTRNKRLLPDFVASIPLHLINIKV